MQVDWNPDTYLAEMLADVFVLGDVVVPERPEEYDLPSSLAEQLAWLREAGLDAEASHVRPDLAVFVARRLQLR